MHKKTPASLTGLKSLFLVSTRISAFSGHTPGPDTSLSRKINRYGRKWTTRIGGKNYACRHEYIEKYWPNQYPVNLFLITRKIVFLFVHFFFEGLDSVI